MSVHNHGKFAKQQSAAAGARNTLSMDVPIQGEKVVEKSSELSAQARDTGIKMYNQQEHDENIHRAILYHYTKSIALAPNGTEELALLYSNRSQLLMHLQRYKESLGDFDRACAITKSKSLIKVMQKKREECLQLLSRNKNMDQNNLYSTTLKNVEPSDMLPDAANSISLNYSNTFGRHLIATRDIKPGEILIHERSYICFPYNSHLYLVCSHCLQFSWNAIPCDTCVFTVYCSETCRDRAWQEYHDIECSILPYLYFLAKNGDNIVTVMATTRLLIKAIKKEGFTNVLKEARISNDIRGNSTYKLLSNGVLRNDKFKSYCNLMDNREPIHNDNDYYELAAVTLLFRYTNLIRKNEYYNVSAQEQRELIELKALFRKLKNIIYNNAITQTDLICNCLNTTECAENCDTKRGLIIGPCSSLINHSCSPNVEKMCVKGKILVYSSAPIKKGEQINESYGLFFHSLVKCKRQRMIKEKFSFSCKCTACTANWPITMERYKYPKVDNQHKFILKSYPEFVKDFKAFVNQKESSFLKFLFENSEFNEENFKEAIRFTEWVFDHYGKGMAGAKSLMYRAYIVHAMEKLFGEKCVMLAKCK